MSNQIRHTIYSSHSCCRALLCLVCVILVRHLSLAQSSDEDPYFDKNGLPYIASHPMTPAFFKSFTDSIGFNYKELQQRLQRSEEQNRLFKRDSILKAAHRPSESAGFPAGYEDPAIRLEKLKREVEDSAPAASRLGEFLKTKSLNELNQVGALIRDSDYTKEKIVALIDKRDNLAKEISSIQD